MPSAFLAFKLDNSHIPPLNTAHYSAHLPENCVLAAHTRRRDDTKLLPRA